MSSFRKRNVQKPISGTRTSPQTGQVITSSGNPSLDVILGGGLAIGSICLIEEDKYVTHSEVLAKYFLAEGILSEQSVFLGSLDNNPEALLRKLPKPLMGEELEQERAADAEHEDIEGAEGAPKNGLRIAWRYNDLPIVNSEQATTKIGHYFNLLEYMEPRHLQYAEKTVWSDETHRMDSLGGDFEEEGLGGIGAAVVEDDDEDVVRDINTQGAGSITPPAEDAQSTPPASEQEDSKDVEMENAKNAATDGQTEPMDMDQQKPVTTANTLTTSAASNLNDTDTSSVGAEAVVASERSERAQIFQNGCYLRLLSNIQGLLNKDKFTIGALGPKGLCRLCITSLGSPLWYDEHFPQDIIKFLTVLRGSMRSAVSVCFITMPMHLVAKADPTLVAKIRNLVDYSIELESFAGSERETHPAYQQYSGLLHLRKISAINALSAYMPETTDLVFKLRRKKFVIEKLHLPPELQDEDDKPRAPTMSCSSAGVGGGGPGNILGTTGATETLDF